MCLGWGGDEGGSPLHTSGERNLYTALLPLWGLVGKGERKAGKKEKALVVLQCFQQIICLAENINGFGAAQGGPDPREREN